MMKSGRVVNIRVNPKDCMTAIDIAQKVGLVVHGMSFAQLVSIALKASFETFRHNKMVPDRQGFEFTEMMAPFTEERTSRKLAVTRTVELAGSEIRVPPLPERPPPDQAPESSPAVARIERQIAELRAREIADPLNPQTEEIMRLNTQLAELLKGEQRG